MNNQGTNVKRRKYPKLSTDPICANPGCTAIVVFSTMQKSGKRTPQAFCGSCKTAYSKKFKGEKYKFKKCVTGLIKTGKCSDKNCCHDYEKSDRLGRPYPITQMDHIDGDSFNNIPKNLQELCSPCHQFKSMKSGDLNPRKRK